MTNRTRTRRRPSSSVAAGSSRFVLERYAEDPTLPDLAASVEDALRNGLAVRFLICRGDDPPLFVIRPYRGVVHVVGWRGDVLATCAAVETALSRGWEYASPVRPARRKGSRWRGAGLF